MSIEINNIKPVDDDKNWIHITLTVDGDEVKYTTVNPWNQPGSPLTGQALQAWCDGREEWFALNILKQMYPGARYQDTEGDTELEKFSNWITDGHTNAAYATGGQPYCTIPTPPYCTKSIPAYCSGAEGNDQETCELNGGTWLPSVPITTQEACEEAFGEWVTDKPLTPQDACEDAGGTWVTVFDTEEKALLAGATWTPETVIEKVPFTDSHNFTGDMRTRKLEQLNTELQAYLYTKYDVGTQISFQAIDTRADTPEVVKTALGILFVWISSVMNYYYAKKALIRDTEDWQDVTWDFTTFDATDPDISLEELMVSK